MRKIAHQAAVLSIARMANFGLMVISPLVLVRFLTVPEFGQYREFLLYISLLGSIASFAISESLLYFIPLHPRSTWRIVRETTVLTAIISSAVVVAFVAVDLLVPGGLVGPYLIPVALYVLLFVNVDCWEIFWIATGRPTAVFVYTAGRLAVRMLVVVCVAVMTTNVTHFMLDLGEVLAGRDDAKVAHARARAMHTLPVIVGFTVGGMFGAALEPAAGLWSFALPAGLALLAFAMAFADRLRPSAC